MIKHILYKLLYLQIEIFVLIFLKKFLTILINHRFSFKAAAEAMRRILVENARRKKAQKRGAGQPHVSFDSIEIPSASQSDDIIALDEALTKLATKEPVLAEVVQLRYFAGLTIEHIAEIMSVSRRTTTSYWAYARSWLRREMTEGEQICQ